MTKCPDLNKIKFKTQDDGFYIKYVASIDGRSVGHAKLSVSGPKLAVVRDIEVSEQYHRCKVGTAIYKRMQETACDRGLKLASDEIRSNSANAFWYKQERKGIAHCVKDPHGTWGPCERFETNEKCGPAFEGLKKKRKRS